MVLTYSEVRKKYEPAFSTREVGELLGRNSRMVERYARWGKIPPVAVAHGLKGNRPQFDPLKWCEQDIMYLHDYLLTLQRGKPRADGRVIPNPPLPTKKELRALIRHETVLYVLNADGEFVPTWKA